MTDSNISVQREFLYASMADTEGTIRATDAKASFALVLHGLLFSTIVALTSDLGDTYIGAPCAFKAVLVALGVIVTLCFLVSVISLVFCVAPAPRSLLDGIGNGKGIFFLLPSDGSKRFRPVIPSRVELRKRLDHLDEGVVLDELLDETAKLAIIRSRKISLIGLGFRVLIAEIILVVAYTLLIASRVI